MKIKNQTTEKELDRTSIVISSKKPCTRPKRPRVPEHGGDDSVDSRNLAMLRTREPLGTGKTGAGWMGCLFIKPSTSLWKTETGPEKHQT